MELTTSLRSGRRLEGAGAAGLVGFQMSVGNAETGRLRLGYAGTAPQQIADNVVRFNGCVAFDVAEHRGGESRGVRGEHLSSPVQLSFPHGVAFRGRDGTALLQQSKNEVGASRRRADISDAGT